MYRSVIAISALALVLMSGCGVVCDLFGLESDCFIPQSESGSSELKAFTSEKELADYFADQVGARNDQFVDIGLRGTLGGDADFTAAPGSNEANGQTDTSAPSDGGGATDDFSQTTTQEVGVDEADVVKTDGNHIYTISSAGSGSVLRIIRASIPETLALLDEVALEGYGRDIYLYDGKIVAVTQTYGMFFYAEPLLVDGTRLVEDVSYERPKTIVTVVDVSTPDAATILSETRFDGSPSSSRMIDGVLHLVVSNYQDYYYDVMPMLGQPELDVASVDTSELLPKYEQVDSDNVESGGDVVTWRELYHPTDADGFGVVTLISLDVDADAAFTAVGVVAEPGLIYSSLNALYLTDTEWDFLGDTRETTDIYKFAYRDRGAEPVATGTVPGRILNQYSMGEHDSYLRVATTVGPTFSLLDGQALATNNVYILEQSGTGLNVIGSTENIAPGETIRSARFAGKRGYLVTFREMDPFFTLDLTDPTNPKVIGELEMPGFSTFLLPMDEDHILAVGQHIPPAGFFSGWGVQLSIFDVTDFANPVRTAHVVLGEGGSASSEALYNPKALTYFAERGLLALPVSIYEGDIFFGGGVVVDVDGTTTGGTGDAGVSVDAVDSEPAPPPDESVALDEPMDVYVPQGFDGLIVYSVSAEAGFSELGRISTRIEAAGIYWSQFTRGVFIGDDVFAVTDSAVRGAPVSDIASVPYELVLPPVQPVGVVEPDGVSVSSTP